MAIYNGLDELIRDYKETYVEWCKHGGQRKDHKPTGITKWVNHKGGGYYLQPYSGSDGPVDSPFNIYHECKEGRYVDTVKPWLYYDDASGIIGIYCVYFRKCKELIIFPVQMRPIPKGAIITYANEHSLKAEIIRGKGGGDGVDVVVLKGTQADFDRAGWNDELKKAQLKREAEQRAYQEACKEARKKITAVMPLIEHAYNSDLMKSIDLNEGKRHFSSHRSEEYDYGSYTLYSHGIMWHRTYKYGSLVEDSFSPFSNMGYGAIETDEQLLAFAIAILCKKNCLEPHDLDVERIEGTCEITKDQTGKKINMPRLLPKSVEQTQKSPQLTELKSIF